MTQSSVGALAALAVGCAPFPPAMKATNSSISTTTRPREWTLPSSRRCCRISPNSMAIRRAATASDSRWARRWIKARERVAALIGCEPAEIVFTSCGTESTNAAINSALLMDRDRQHIVTTRVEHSATLKHCETLAKRGHEVTWLGVDEHGQIDLAELEKAIRPDTAHRHRDVGEQRDRRALSRSTRSPRSSARKRRAFSHRRGAGRRQDPAQSRGVENQFPLPLRPQAALPERRRRALREPADEVCAVPHRRRPGERQTRGDAERREHRRRSAKACELAGEFMEHEATDVRALRDAFENGVLDADRRRAGQRRPRASAAEHDQPRLRRHRLRRRADAARPAPHLLLQRLRLHHRLRACLACAQGDGLLATNARAPACASRSAASTRAPRWRRRWRFCRRSSANCAVSRSRRNRIPSMARCLARAPSAGGRPTCGRGKTSAR